MATPTTSFIFPDSGDDRSMGFSQTLANLMKRARHTPSTLAKCIVAEHPEMASPRKKFLSSCYATLAVKLASWCRNCVPDTHSDFKLILALEAKQTKNDNGPLKDRVRQNVLLELGSFLARLGRDKVCALKKGDVDTSPMSFGK